MLLHKNKKITILALTQTQTATIALTPTVTLISTQTQNLTQTANPMVNLKNEKRIEQRSAHSLFSLWAVCNITLATFKTQHTKKKES